MYAVSQVVEVSLVRLIPAWAGGQRIQLQCRARGDEMATPNEWYYRSSSCRDPVLHPSSSLLILREYPHEPLPAFLRVRPYMLPPMEYVVTLTTPCGRSMPLHVLL